MMASMSAPGRERAGTLYEIVVRGELGESVADEIGACWVEPRRGRTLLVIDIIDQSHLRGVLEYLGDLNIDIESVNPA